ncbi:opacity-associated A LysM-like domain protein, partial [Yersinia pestis PY-72]
MGRIAPRRRKNNRVYQPLLHSWLTIRQKVLPDAKNTDEQNLISEINAPEQRVDPDNVTEPALAPTQR